MASKHKFYRTVYMVEVLSDEPVHFERLHEVDEARAKHEVSGSFWDEISNEEVDGPTMATLLLHHASDPSFFGLDEEGNDLDENDGDVDGGQNHQ
jgi:hypothetical protein